MAPSRAPRPPTLRQNAYGGHANLKAEGSPLIGGPSDFSNSNPVGLTAMPLGGARPGPGPGILAAVPKAASAAAARHLPRMANSGHARPAPAPGSLLPAAGVVPARLPPTTAPHLPRLLPPRDAMTAPPGPSPRLAGGSGPSAKPTPRAAFLVTPRNAPLPSLGAGPAEAWPASSVAGGTVGALMRKRLVSDEAAAAPAAGPPAARAGLPPAVPSLRLPTGPAGAPPPPTDSDDGSMKSSRWAQDASPSARRWRSIKLKPLAGNTAALIAIRKQQQEAAAAAAAAVAAAAPKPETAVERESRLAREAYYLMDHGLPSRIVLRAAEGKLSGGDREWVGEHREAIRKIERRAHVGHALEVDVHQLASLAYDNLKLAEARGREQREEAETAARHERLATLARRASVVAARMGFAGPPRAGEARRQSRLPFGSRHGSVIGAGLAASSPGAAAAAAAGGSPAGAAAGISPRSRVEAQRLALETFTRKLSTGLLLGPGASALLSGAAGAIGGGAIGGGLAGLPAGASRPRDASMAHIFSSALLRGGWEGRPAAGAGAGAAIAPAALARAPGQVQLARGG